jgi:hypothetical protein
MRPKWLLTHPDGRIMAEKAIEGCRIDRFFRIIFIVTRVHDEEFEATLVLRQALAHLGDRLEIVVLPEFTSGQAETIVRAIETANVTGTILIKDSDNHIAWDDGGDLSNFVVVGNLELFPGTTNVAAKSYVSIDKNDIVLDIVEKRIISGIFCAGAYQVASAEAFRGAYLDMSKCSGLEKETYVSHVIGWMMARDGEVFKAYEANSYEDWGTLHEWRAKQKRFSTLFCDFDGVLVENIGRYGSRRWENSMDPIESNLRALKIAHQNGAEIIIVTARTSVFRTKILALLHEYEIEPHAIVTDCRHSHRVIINDFALTNPYPSCSAISLPRDGDLGAFLQDYIL